MAKSSPDTIRRLDYQASPWSILRTGLTFELDPTATRVTSQLKLRHNADGNARFADLILQGVDCKLVSVSVDGQVLNGSDYELSDVDLRLKNLPVSCQVSIVTLINPDANTALEGLYRSSGNFCTQCEAEGFRKITYYLDRPDVLSVFDVEIIAAIDEYPVLLSNGNHIKNEILGNGKHRAIWHDPHPKPSYLFALVAGNLEHIEQIYKTSSGRSVLLQIYVQKHNIHLCDFAMESLVASMRWDEQVYGLEYDLDCFMIVAVDDFNMGAMENKGLNIFNSRFVLADPMTATDADYLGVEAVIAHEYFHNWTGNRITCRDWFQLSLKEGLTVFRDQCFSSDQRNAMVKRIEDVRLLRARQFPEDAGPLAHPIRPESYIEINNFYTLTVYEKGAEVIRMLHTLLGADAWRRGMDLYVEQHDGTATTCDAFIDVMQAVSDIDLTQFRLWYSTAGTPTLTVSDAYDEKENRYSLTIRQHCADSPGQRDKKPLHIPLVMGLINAEGQDLPLKGRSTEQGLLLDITKEEETFHFENIATPPIASLLRGFSAPVKLEQSMSDETLLFLVRHDSDGFNRWEASQVLAHRVILRVMQGELAADACSELILALQSILLDSSLEPAFKAEALHLPTLDTIAEAIEAVDYQQLVLAYDSVHLALAESLKGQLFSLCDANEDKELPILHTDSIGKRSLKNASLRLLSYLSSEQWVDKARNQYHEASNMTNRVSALACLCHTNDAVREECLEDFYQFALGSRLVMDKWFAVQACSRRSSIFRDIDALLTHKDFDLTNPNRLRALVASFAMNNPKGFHSTDGAGYHFVANQVIALDKLNPQVAARLAGTLGRWKRLSVTSGSLMKAQLERIMNAGDLSPDVFELVSKSLAE